MKRKKFLAVVKTYGAELNDIDGQFIIDAPKGKRWVGNGYHCIVACWRWDDPVISEKPAAYAWAIETMEYGLKDCPDSDCPIGHENLTTGS